MTHPAEKNTGWHRHDSGAIHRDSEPDCTWLGNPVPCDPPSATPMTLTDFLLARIAEDEAVIREESELGAEFVIPPRRMLAECEAKRRIVALRGAADCPAHPSSFVRGQDNGFRQGLDEALAALALPYADHPDYRDEWRP